MVQPQSLLDFALERIREDIQNGKYAPGSKLSSKDIADELGISRTPVNAAINRLVAEGLAEAIPRRGTIVAELSAKKTKDVIDVRVMMETFATKGAVENLDKHPEIVAEMESILDQLDNIGDHEYPLASRLEARFHLLLVTLSENEQLISLFQNNWSVGAVFHVHVLAKSPLSSQYKEYNVSHREILRLLKEKKQKELEKAIAKHIDICYYKK